MGSTENEKKNRNRFRLSCIGGILLLFVIAALFAPILLKKLFPMPYLEIVKKYAADNQLKITLVYSVMKTESGFRTEVVSPKGAVGLMQITEKQADGLQTVWVMRIMIVMI